MSLLKTKPLWHRGEVIATDSGWVNPVNNEILVSVRNLKTRLHEEFIKNKPVKSLKVEELKKEESNIMDTPKVKPVGKKSKLIIEVVESTLKDKQKILGEVVENDLDEQIIGE